MLQDISGPRDLDVLSLDELQRLAAEVREYLIAHVSKTGGHLGPNLGVVELTIALHRVFESPLDPIVWDTGHQSYVHKLLTGRQDFTELRQRGGLAGYPQRAESAHDIVESSHASSSLSWADGISRAFALTGQTGRHVVAVVGDGALTGGMTWEALNNITDDNDRNLVIVVNDNGRSYAPTIGGIARFLNTVRTTSSYRELQEGSEKLFGAFGSPGRVVYRAARGAMRGVASRVSGNQDLYSNLDIKYVGPIDGHDLEALELALRQAKSYGRPTLVHVITEKGRGYAPAENHVGDQFHAIGQIDVSTGASITNGDADGKSFTEVFGAELVELARADSRIVALTAAMLAPTGLAPFATEFADRVQDVGIAEQHAVTSAAGLAYGGLHPVVAVYATFMNRAIDQFIMDVALHRAPVTLVLDRAGITGPDGASHNGVWDLAMLRVVPTVRIAAPRDEPTLRALLGEAVCEDGGPTVVRFPKGSVGEPIVALRTLEDGVDVLWESVIGTADGSGTAAAPPRRVLLVSAGPLARAAVEAASRLTEQGIGVTVVDPRWVIPIADSVVELARQHDLVVSLEDGVRAGGVGTSLSQALSVAGVDRPVVILGVPDGFLAHASRDELLTQCGLAPTEIVRTVLDRLAAVAN